MSKVLFSIGEKKVWKIEHILLIILAINLIATAFKPPTTVAAPPGVHNLSTGEDFATIQQAIDDPDTVNGNIILVDAGTYVEHVNVYKRLSIIGENKDTTIIDGSGTGTVVEISWLGPNNVIFTRFTIRNGAIGLNSKSFRTSISNDIIRDSEWGVILSNSRNNTFRNNIILDNQYNFGVSGTTIPDYVNDVDSSNTVGGKPIYYWINKKDMTVPLNAGYVALINCTHITSQDLSITNNMQCILMAYTTNSTITKTNMTKSQYGIYLTSSSNNNITENKITDNYQGIWLSNSSINNNIVGNNITANNEDGIYLSSSNNTIVGNDIANNKKGIELSFSANNSIVENKIANNDNGVWLSNSSINNYIVGNNITTNNEDGIYLSSSNNTVVGNNVTNNQRGIELSFTSNNILRNNTMADNTYNFVLIASNLSDFINDVDASNNVNGKPIYYWINRQNTDVPLDAGYVALVNCSRIIVQNSSLSKNYQGVLSAFSTNSTISGNHIAQNKYGIEFHNSSGNTISGNNITTSDFSGIWLTNSSSNTISGNNIVDNNIQVYDRSWSDPTNVPPSINTWNYDYPFGGNYWSDYNNPDVYSGMYQNETGTDGIGDTSYGIDANNQDNYPLMKPWPTRTVEATVTIGAEHYTLIIKSNAAITHAVATKNTLHFLTFGAIATTGYITVISPFNLNKSQIRVFVDGIELMPPPSITFNGTHYLIHFELTFSSHDIVIQYAIVDIATTNVTPAKTSVGHGYTVRISITVQNQGNYEETFNITLYVNTTPIATQVVTLQSGNSKTITFTWDTTSFAKGTYSVWAYASPVKGETETADNEFIDGSIVVTISGDINGDGIVNFLDAILLGTGFGSTPSGPHWNPNADVNSDDIVNYLDAIIVGSHFGQTDP